MSGPVYDPTSERMCRECGHGVKHFDDRALVPAFDCSESDRLIADLRHALAESQQRAEIALHGSLTFDHFRAANVSRCLKWHPAGIGSWSAPDWLTAVTGELGELASLIKMRNRERDGLPGNKFNPTDQQIADELADVFIYLDLLAAALGVDLGRAVIEKFNEVSERVGFPDRVEKGEASTETAEARLAALCGEVESALGELDATILDLRAFGPQDPGILTVIAGAFRTALTDATRIEMTTPEEPAAPEVERWDVEVTDE